MNSNTQLLIKAYSWCRNGCLNQCDYRENDPTKNEIIRFFQDGGQNESDLARSHDQPEIELWLVSNFCVTTIRNITRKLMFSQNPRWRRRFSSEVPREVLVTETTSRQIDVLMFISYIDIAAILVRWPRPLKQTIVPLYQEGFTWNLISFGQAVSTEKKF